MYYVPGLIAYGLITAAFSNLALSVVRNRESGIYKRRRATPLPASVVIASRAAIAVLTALAITAVMLHDALHEGANVRFALREAWTREHMPDQNAVIDEVFAA